MTSQDLELQSRYKSHRERLLRLVKKFEMERKRLEDAFLAEVRAYSPLQDPSEHPERYKKWRAAPPKLRAAFKPLSAGMSQEQREFRRREYLAHLINRSEEAVSFQRKWLVLLHPAPAPPLALTFSDDFFVETTAKLSERHHLIGRVHPSRLLIVDEAAGQNAVLDELKKCLKKRVKGEVSRLPSDPPFDIDRTDGRDPVAEDLIIVRLCANQAQPPQHLPQSVAAEAYPNLAQRVGYSPGESRIPNKKQGTPDAKHWSRILKAVGKRWPKLRRVIGPFEK